MKDNKEWGCPLGDDGGRWKRSDTVSVAHSNESSSPCRFPSPFLCVPQPYLISFDFSTLFLEPPRRTASNPAEIPFVFPLSPRLTSPSLNTQLAWLSILG
jgi:hypothetical protein